VIGYLRSHAVTFALATSYQLGYVGQPLQGDEGFTGALSIPYLSRAGVTSIKFRRLRDEGPKFLYHIGQKQRLYNSLAYFAADGVIGITEGEIDAIVATEVIGIPSIGIPGAETWKENADVWGPVFRDFGTVIMFADGDPVNPKTGARPGRELAKRISATVGWRVHIVECPEGEDVSSMAASGRAGELRERCELGDEDV
jgi:hypothetical protein